MKRRITIEVSDMVLASIRSHPAEWAARVTLDLLKAADAQLADRLDACPTCEGVGCERCLTTGRKDLCKVAIYPTTTGRATVEVWQGPPGTQQPIAFTPPDRDVADDTIDALLACLADGGLVVDDRRGR